MCKCVSLLLSVEEHYKSCLSHSELGSILALMQAKSSIPLWLYLILACPSFTLVTVSHKKVLGDQIQLGWAFSTLNAKDLCRLFWKPLWLLAHKWQIGIACSEVRAYCCRIAQPLQTTVMAVLMGPFGQWMSGRLPSAECRLFSLVFDPACHITLPHLHWAREEPGNTDQTAFFQEEQHQYSFDNMALHVLTLYRRSDLGENP